LGCSAYSFKGIKKFARNKQLNKILNGEVIINALKQGNTEIKELSIIIDKILNSQLL